MICAARIKEAEVGSGLLLFQRPDQLASTWPRPPSRHAVPHGRSLCRAQRMRATAGPRPSCGSGSGTFCEVQCSGWAHVPFSQTVLGLSAVLLQPQQALSFIPLSLLCSAFPPFYHLSAFLFLTLCLSLHSFCPPPPSYTPPVFPAPLESKAFYGEFITTAAIVRP